MTIDARPAHGKTLMVAVSMALFCVQIDYFAMNLALPRMASDFDSTATDLQWIISIYMVTLGALMVPAGRLADIFGRKRVLLIGITLFGLASLLCAIAASVAALNIPLAAACVLIGAFAISESRDTEAPRRIDVAGLALLTAGIGVFTLTFDRASVWGWWSLATAGALTGAIALLALFVVVERRVRWPLVDLSLARNMRFTVLVAAGSIANVAYGVTIFLSTVYLQDARGLDPLAAGLVFLGPSAGAAAGGVLSGRLAAGHPVRVMGVATILAAASLGLLAAARDWALYVPTLTACGFTLGLVYAFTTVATQAVVSPQRAGEAAGIALTVMIVMGGVGVAVASTMLERLRSTGMSTAGGIDVIFAILAAALLPAGLLVVAVASRTADPASERC